MPTSLGGGREWSILVILCLSLQYSEDIGNIANVVIIFFSEIDFYSYRLEKKGRNHN